MDKAKKYLIKEYELIILQKNLDFLNKATEYHFKENKNKTTKKMLENDKVFLKVYYLMNKIINNCN